MYKERVKGMYEWDGCYWKMMFWGNWLECGVCIDVSYVWFWIGKRW